MKTIFLLRAACVLGCMLGVFPAAGAPTLVRHYSYTVQTASPPFYDAVYDDRDCYLSDASGEPLLYFLGNGAGLRWGAGTQATRLSEINPLPHGIRVRWFSLREDQFWQGEHLFDQALLNRLLASTVHDVVERRESRFDFGLSFIVNVAPDGLVVVWLVGSGESHVVAQFHAVKVEEPDWQRFVRFAFKFGRDRNLPEHLMTRERYLAHYADAQNASGSGRSPLAAPVDGAAHFEHLMRTYPWVLTMRAPWQLEDYRVWYLNGEMHNIPLSTDQAGLAPRAAPRKFIFDAENQDNRALERFSVELDDDQVLAAFRRLAGQTPYDGVMELRFEISPGLDEITALLVKGGHSVELEPLLATVDDLYRDMPSVCVFDDPALRMTDGDLTEDGEKGRLFVVTDQSGHPLPNYRYRILREDGRYVYGATRANGQTVRVIDRIDGRRLKLWLYDDERSGCVTQADQDEWLRGKGLKREGDIIVRSR